MLRNLITGAKYRSENTGQMTNLNIATPADSNDTNFSSSDILLAKDTVKIIDDKIANKKSFKFVEKLPDKIEDVDPDVIYIVNSNDIDTKNVEIINTRSSIGGGVNDKNTYCEYVFEKYENKRLYYELLGESNELPLLANQFYASVSTLRSLANGFFSTAFGQFTVTNNDGECAVGRFNKSIKNGDLATLFSVGDGTNDNNRHNVFEVKANGDIYMTAGSAAPDNTESFKLQELLLLFKTIQNQISSLEQRVSTLENK